MTVVPSDDGGEGVEVESLISFRTTTTTMTRPANFVDNNNHHDDKYSTVPVQRPSKQLNGHTNNENLPNEEADGTTITNGLVHSVVEKYSGTAVAVKPNNYKNYERTRRRLPHKKFEVRESIMSHMLQMEEYQGLYNIFLVVIINITIYTIISELSEHGSVDLGVSNILHNFGKPSIFIPLLIGMHLCACFPFYYTFKIWADHRPSFYTMESVWDLSFSIALGLFIYGFYYIPFQVNVLYRLPPASATIIVLEQLRLSMKFYAFVRENIPKVLRSCEEQLVQGGTYSNSSSSHFDNENNLILSKPIRLRKITDEDEVSSLKEDDKENDHQEKKKMMPKFVSPCPDYSRFAYFMYAPTLIYRDNYPRTKEIRWNFILTNAVELLGCIYFYNLTQHMCGFVQLKNFGLPGHQVTVCQLVRMVFFQMIPGGLSILLGFFLLLHNTQNIGAELLKFGDRMFYLDWWNSDSFGAYYRKWNLPVHDFLHAYIYKEAKEARLDKIAKPLPAILVFLLSSLFHEYVFIFVLQFFYPILIIFFGGFGMALAFVPNKGSRSKGNLFIWWSLITGMGLIHSFYCLEYYARVNNCPPAVQNPKLDFVLPRTWTCGAIVLS